jgi:hypothetical protein
LDDATALVAAVASSASANPDADWTALQSKAEYDQVFQRATKGVEPLIDGASNRMDCEAHWHPPNMFVEKDETTEGRASKVRF